MDYILFDFDLTKQEVISSTKSGGQVFMVKSKTNHNYYLSFYQDENGLILNVKKIFISAIGDNLTVEIVKLDDTKYFTAEGNVNDDFYSVTSYNEDVFGSIETRSKSLGCSASLMTASIPWSMGFGMLNPFAGLAANVVFWAMSEIMC